MATNKLFEAAADILSKSHSSAPADPPKKLEGEVQDLGGPTNKNAQPMNHAEKIKAGEMAPDNSAKNKASISTKPSDASPDTQNKMKQEEAESEVDEVISEEETTEGLDLSEDIDAMFSGEQISEEFRSKVTTIFEARVYDKVAQIQEQLESEYASMLEEAIESVSQDLTEKVNDYLSYVVEQWIAENEIAIESGLRSELTEEFIAGMRNLFAEHYIDVPSEKVDLVEELATKVEELETKLNEEIEYGVEMKKALVEAVKSEITHEVTEGLTATQVEKIKSLAEGVEFSTEEQFREKLETIRENYFPSNVKKAEASQLHEQVEDESEQKSGSADPYVQSVMKAISKTKI
jgi:methyltransferase-like protein